MLRSSAPDWLNWMYVLQVLFLLFVLATVRLAWRGVGVNISRPADHLQLQKESRAQVPPNNRMQRSAS
jgi:uncharacterized protein involved in cysteine biosynthesis